MPSFRQNFPYCTKEMRAGGRRRKGVGRRSHPGWVTKAICIDPGDPAFSSLPLCVLCRGAEGEVLAGKWQAPAQSITSTHNSPANEQAHLTKPSLPLWLVAQLPSCAPLFHLHGGSRATPLMNSWLFAKRIISPFCPQVWLALLAYSSFSSNLGISCAKEPQQQSRCSQLSPSPTIRFARV